MKKLREILDNKILAEDRGVEYECAEEESSLIKGYFRDNWNNPDNLFISLIKYFPSEYGEIESEKE